jgi:hypothetical protein
MLEADRLGPKPKNETKYALRIYQRQLGHVVNIIITEISWARQFVQVLYVCLIYFPDSSFP